MLSSSFIIPNDDIVAKIERGLTDDDVLSRWVANLALGRRLENWTKKCRKKPIQIDQMRYTKEVRVTILSPTGLFGALTDKLLLRIIDTLPIDDVVSMN